MSAHLVRSGYAVTFGDLRINLEKKGKLKGIMVVVIWDGYTRKSKKEAVCLLI